MAVSVRSIRRLGISTEELGSSVELFRIVLVAIAKVPEALSGR